jgi:valyl-tRNA synthetase
MDGKKMSKSLGNVINPDEYVETYGVDALRMGLISGTAGGKDFAFPRDKVIAYRNFANKLWNMARFYLMMGEKSGVEQVWYRDIEEKMLSEVDKNIVKRLEETIGETEKNLENFRFAQAAETIYHYMWDEVASGYLEQVKEREDKETALAVLLHVLHNGLKLLHPFMPYVTEAIWQELPRKKDEMLIVSKWPAHG